MYKLQKASILKRISAFLLDFILICILATGFAALISVIVDFDGKMDKIEQLEAKCFNENGLGDYIKLEKDQEPTLNITEEFYNSMPQQGKDAYDAARKSYKEQSGKDFISDYMYLYGLAFVMVSLGLFFAILLVEFVAPLIFKHGRTVGKKVFGVGVMLVSGVKISPVALFVRSMLGKYAVETMVPVALVFMFVIQPNIAALVVIAAIWILQLVLVIATKNNSLIHDVMSSTVTVDMATQVIFDSNEELLEFKQRQAAEQAEKAQYK